MVAVITASEPSWIAPFTGLIPRGFSKLVTALRREGADAVRRGRPWSLSLESRVLLVTAYWRTNLTLRQLDCKAWELSGAKDAVGHMTVIADRGYRGTGLVIPHRRERGQAELPAWKEEHNAFHRKVRARVEHAFARMKTWKILRDCRRKGDGVHHAMLGTVRLHNLTLAG
ncbi:transposase [Streptomyces malaysiensis]|uniref:transposase n=1 Tax=Streptomyces malaysiensis TaxID=92644 RepID=UPI002B2DC946|nr:transposase family protein [Streptomyces malaysiensis]